MQLSCFQTYRILDGIDTRDFIENPFWNGNLVNSIIKRRFSSKITQNGIRESVIDALKIGYFPVTGWV